MKEGLHKLCILASNLFKKMPLNLEHRAMLIFKFKLDASVQDVFVRKRLHNVTCLCLRCYLPIFFCACWCLRSILVNHFKGAIKILRDIFYDELLESIFGLNVCSVQRFTELSKTADVCYIEFSFLVFVLPEITFIKLLPVIVNDFPPQMCVLQRWPSSPAAPC